MPKVIEHLTPDGLAELIREAGYRAKIDLSGQCAVIGSGMNGVRISVVTFGAATACDTVNSIQIRARFTFPPGDMETILEAMNAFNSKIRFAKGVFYEDDQSLAIEMDILVSQPTAQDLLNDALSLFEDMLAKFMKVIADLNAPR